MSKDKAKEEQEAKAREKAQADEKSKEQEEQKQKEAQAKAKANEESPEAKAEREADAREQDRARREAQTNQPQPAPKLRDQAQAFAQGGPGDRSAVDGGDDLTPEERQQLEAYKIMLRNRRSGEPSPGGIDPFALSGDPGGPPRMTPEEIARARDGSAQARPGAPGVARGETDPGAIPTLAKEQGDPDRVPTEGEIAANVEVLHTKGDTSPMHPMYQSPSVTLPGSAPRKEGDKAPRMFRVVGGQVGAIASPDRGGPNRAISLEELGIPEGSIPRLIDKGVIVEDNLE